MRNLRMYCVVFLCVGVLAWLGTGCGEEAPKDECQTAAECGKGERCFNNKCRKVPKVNQPPLANAGKGQVVRMREKVQLDGRESSDPEQQLLSYQWSFAEKPKDSKAKLENATTAQPSFVADAPGYFVVKLVVSDGESESQPSRVTIEVTGKEANGNPVANAGQDIFVGIGDRVELDGSKSSDPENDPLTYSWSFKSGPPGSRAKLNNQDKEKPSFAPDVLGKYIIQLVVNDGLENSDPDTVIVNCVEGSKLVPQLTELKPSEAPTNTEVTVEVIGKDMVGESAVFFDGLQLDPSKVKFIGPTKIEVTLSLIDKKPGSYELYVKNTNGKVSNKLLFKALDIPEPVLSSISPPAVPENSKFTLKVTGENFLKDSNIVFFPGTPLATTYVDDKTLTAQVDVSTLSQGEYDIWVTNPGGKRSTALKLTVLMPGPPPSLTALSPPFGTQGTTVKPLSLFGKAFLPNPTVLFDGKPVSGAVRVSRNEVEIPALDLTKISVGKYDVQVINIDGQKSEKVVFEVKDTNPTPYINRVLPFTMYVGDSLQADVYGNDFQSGCVAYLCGKKVKTIYRSYNLVKMDLDLSSATAQQCNVEIENPSGKRSNAFQVDIVKVTPTLNGIAPSELPTDVTGTKTIVLQGQFFFRSATVVMGSSPTTMKPVSTKYVSAGEVTFTATPSTMKQGVYYVAVKNGTNGGQTDPKILRITAPWPNPVVDRITPATARMGTASYLTIYTKNTKPGYVITIGKQKVTCTYLSTSGYCSISRFDPGTAGLGVGKHAVVVTNPDGKVSKEKVELEVLQANQPIISSLYWNPGGSTNSVFSNKTYTYVQLYGQGFASPYDVLLDGKPYTGSRCQPSRCSSRYIYLNQFSTTNLKVGKHKLQVRNLVGGKTYLSNEFEFTVRDANTPHIRRVSWTSPPLYTEKVFSTVRIEGESNWNSPYDVLLDGKPYTGKKRCYKSYSYNYCYLEKFSTVGMKAGDHTFQLRNTISGKTYDSATYKFKLLARSFSITIVDPPYGIEGGGNTVSIRGFEFKSGIKVTFGSTAATNVKVVSSNLVTVTTPKGSAGKVNVKVELSGKTSTLTSGFTYTGVRATVGWCILQWPPTMALSKGALSATMYGRVWKDRVTPGPGPGYRISAHVGYGPKGSNPATDARWVWSQGEYNYSYGSSSPGYSYNNDEWQGKFTAPNTAGSYDYLMRFSGDGVYYWFCSTKGNTDKQPYQPGSGNPGALTVK